MTGDRQAGQEAADSPEVDVIIEEWRAFRHRRPDLRIAGPQGRNDDHRRHVTYALDQIDQARAELKTVSK
jgi:hypothetical protein